MNLPPLRQNQIAAESDGTIQRDLYRWLARLAQLQGTLIENVSLTAGVENLVPHGLGGAFKTWWPADPKAAAVIYRYEASTADLKVYLPLLTTADVTCDIVVVPS